jgi:hypothetical protein
MVAWLYIEPFREGGPKEPAGDPVDSDPIPNIGHFEPTVWSQGT